MLTPPAVCLAPKRDLASRPITSKGPILCSRHLLNFRFRTRNDPPPKISFFSTSSSWPRAEYVETLTSPLHLSRQRICSRYFLVQDPPLFSTYAQKRDPLFLGKAGPQSVPSRDILPRRYTSFILRSRCSRTRLVGDSPRSFLFPMFAALRECSFIGRDNLCVRATPFHPLRI